MSGFAAVRFVTATIACLSVGACFSSDAAEPENGFDVEVMASDQLRFEPATVTIRAGQTVGWRNAGSLFQTVTFDPARAVDPAHVALPSGVSPFNASLGASATFSHTFDTPGEYHYICEPHETTGMLGTVIVTP